MSKPTQLTEFVADVREQLLYLKELGVQELGSQIAELEFRAVGTPEVARSPSISNLRAEMTDVGAEISGVKSDISRAEIPNVVTFKSVEPRVPGQSRLASLPSLASLSKKVENRVVLPVDILIERQPDGGRPLQASNDETAVEQREMIVTEPTINLAEQPGNISHSMGANILSKSVETIEQIRAEIGSDCVRCKLSDGRKQVVNSAGNFNAELMFVGEAPGADEDEQGFPFVGRAGKLLTDIMGAIGFAREDVFIGNISRCRPPGNRAPEADETVACKPFLQREIAVVRPKVIVVLGATAAQNLLETKVPIGKLRGQFHDYLGTKVMPTFHPAYLLRDPHKKREVWEDMKLVRDYLTSQK